MLGDVTLAGGDGGIVHQLIFVLLVGICAALVWWTGVWFMGKLGVPAIARTLWDGLFIILGLLFIVNFLLGLSGHPIFRY